MPAPEALRHASSNRSRHQLSEGRESSCSIHTARVEESRSAAASALDTASPNERAPLARTTCTLTCFACGTSIAGPAGEWITSNEVCTDRVVSPVASAMTITPGNTLCVSSERSVALRKRISASTVTTATMPASTSCRCVYGLADMASTTASWISLFAVGFINSQCTH